MTAGRFAKHKLLYVYTAEEDWRIWLEAAGVKGIELSDRLAFDSYILAQEAAIEGRGVAMTIGPFAREEIALGRLVQPFDLKVPHRHPGSFRLRGGQPPQAQDPALRRLARETRWPRTPGFALIAEKERYG